MERSSVFRFLRYAVTTLGLTACVLLIALWVRSFEVQWPNATTPGDYWYSHRLPQPELGPRIYVAESHNGSIQLSTASWNNGWTTEVEYREKSILGFDVRKGPTSLWVRIPHWFPVLLTAVLSIVPWIYWSKRYSLRTLLIATTLVAVGLGTVIYLVR